MSICMKCKAETDNLGNSFFCSSVIDQKTQFTGKSTVMTTTYGKSIVHCVLCEKCIGEYVAKLKHGKVNLFAPVFLLVLSGIIGSLLIGVGQSILVKILGLVLLAVCWYLGIKDIIKQKNNANQRPESMKNADDTYLIRSLEREAEREFLKQTSATVTDVIVGQ